MSTGFPRERLQNTKLACTDDSLTHSGRRWVGLSFGYDDPTSNQALAMDSW